MSYKNFSGWPLNQYTNDGINLVLPPQELYTEVNPKIQEAQIFRNGDQFADDCRFGCGDMPSALAMNGKRSANGSRIGGKDILNIFSTGLGVWGTSQQAKAEAEAAAKAAEIERLRLQQEKEKTQQEQQKVGIIKAYAVPLAIGGAVVIAGIAAYFIFKKKKI